MERSKIRKLNNMEMKELYHVNISNRFATSENVVVVVVVWISVGHG
jgi:hypothetical protein